MKDKIGYLILNTGTPDEPSIPALRRYLKQFLSDPYILDYPAFIRWMVVNLIVVPFRPSRIIKKYKGIWTEEGST